MPNASIEQQLKKIQALQKALEKLIGKSISLVDKQECKMSKALHQNVEKIEKAIQEIGILVEKAVLDITMKRKALNKVHNTKTIKI